LSEKQLRLYLAPGETPPEREVQSKGNITKVMFLAAVARPRFDEEGVCVFEGKIGMWPFVKKVPGQRNSVNRPAGTMVTRSVTVTRQRYRDMLLEKVLPAIQTK